MPQTPETIVGRLPNTTGRRPRTIDEPRVCSFQGCDTKLSRYNVKSLCYQHSPTRFRRVRGRPT